MIKTIKRFFKRPPDRYIGGKENPYMKRWHIIPRNKWFNIYLHHFLRDDEDRALHDHPWHSISVMLKGSYMEHLPGGKLRIVSAPSIKYRNATFMHRIQLHTNNVFSAPYSFGLQKQPVWTLFITGPKVRDWGYDCPQGWRHNTEFNDPKNGDIIGKGCDG
jgi:hypothetical protein